MKTAFFACVIAASFAVGACGRTTDGDEPSTEAQASTITGGPTSPPVYIPPGYCASITNFYQASDGYETNLDLIIGPEKSGTTWTLPATPPTATPTSTWMKWSLGYGGLCPAAVSAADVATYGHLTIDGSPAGVDYLHVYGAAQNELSATLHLPQTPGTHIVKLSYVNPRARFGATPITSTVTVNIAPVNPFSYLRLSYASARCQTCHAFGAGSLTIQDIGHPFQVPADSSAECHDCHKPFYEKYQPTEERHFWSMPGPEKGMDWRSMTPQQQCEATVQHLPSSALLHDHFDTDPRLKWAVESGVLHEGGPAMDTSWPHQVDAFLAIADWWIDSGYSCANLDITSLNRFPMQVTSGL
jgi:hypothetical protein